MNFAQYEALCTEAIALLGTESKALTPTGNESLQLNGATLDLLFDEPQSVLSVVCHLGQPSEEHRTQVYEQLLHLQMLSLHLPGVRFGYDPRLDEVLFCSSTRVGKDTPASSAVTARAACNPERIASQYPSVPASWPATYTGTPSAVAAGVTSRKPASSRCGASTNVLRCITPRRANSAFCNPGIMRNTRFCSGNVRFV